ncbi:hypothetical protein B0T18DRAFT_387412 [Schizothecium vesticola]|uniref:Uncharacterized protein n=1 Tax=Schizothecium vesticola TaxID=314040 RepID=A0AA40F4T7_9PEZI|nr:hypothetical protein B0T18DRAFT_387412 [Schizothecium vesticola]
MAYLYEGFFAQTIYIQVTSPSTSLVANRQWPRVQFVANPYLFIAGATPRLNWDAAYNAFFTDEADPVNLGMFGLVSVWIRDEKGFNTSHRVGILVRAIEFKDPISAPASEIGSDSEETNDVWRRKYRVSFSAEMTGPSSESVRFHVSTKNFVPSEEGEGSRSDDWTELTL